MLSKSKYLIFLIPIFLILAFQSQEKKNPPSSEWPEITQTAKPWTRWWWMGNAVDEKNLSNLLETYHDAGLGGVEIAPIYGAKGYEDRYIDFLSEDWLSMLDFTVNKAQSLGMGVDMTQGTGWPYGGPQVSIEHAATRMIIQDYEKVDGEALSTPIIFQKKRENQFDAELVSVMAYDKDLNAKDITAFVKEDGMLDWNETGDWQIKAIFLDKTGQLVKRAAPGGVGFTLDHFSKSAVGAYNSYFENAFAGKDYGIRSFYNDSFEVYGADFTASFFDEFEKLRGYDLKEFLPYLESEENTEQVRKVKSDYRETINDLLLTNFTKNWTNWAHKQSKLTKNQAHGSPGNLLDLYAAVDIPECETFGSSYFPIPGLRRDSADIRNVDPDPIMLKFASSAAHLTGKNLVSTETFTWLGEHFKSSFSQMKPEVEQAFLAGVNHIFYHGVTYSPEDVPYPGWLFYASLNLTQQNSLWPHFNSFNDFITRSQSILQAGKADNELLVYWPVYDVWAKPKGKMEMITVHAVDEWLHPTQFYKQSKMLMESGYSLDFISDDMISKSKVKEGQIQTSAQNSAKVLIIPETGFMPIETLRDILKLAEEGAKVIFQSKPKSIPGHHSDQKSKESTFNQLWASIAFKGGKAKVGKGQIYLSDDLSKTLEQLEIYREKLVDSGLDFIRRKVADGTFYFLVNHSAEAISQTISLNTKAGTVMAMDPLTGKRGTVSSESNADGTIVNLFLKSGESIFLKTFDEKATLDIPAWPDYSKASSTTDISKNWELTFTHGQPKLPAPQRMETIKPWTDNNSPEADDFSGQANYTSEFELKKTEGKQYLLTIYKVYESAKIWINGKEAGNIWSIPYQLDITEELQNGKNTIKIEVANLMANSIRYLDRNGIEWRNYHEINFVNIDYKPFDASNWKTMPSGLGGKVQISEFD
ncbi:Glycosyl hydrolases family 2, sugar binding domain [Algoriphagus locisalis]|uniref:Glycosyl hydrolases family 2, sugar binding domain n=1 Tax=Algoriphagus locisalis TaxID=305507 RepID=A0A1I6YJN3_9BACT|nr:glycosyl hydrolase [Algoriphagus locisalis]SFT50567.1 Glycosyl hydrolases family 2, sugar binding domain [Algoriphagus locisalis]